MSETLYECTDCGYLYHTGHAAKYCARQDRDPRNENQRLRDGTQKTIVKPAELLDLAGISEYLDVPKDTVNKWRHRGLLPEPDYPLNLGPVWEWDTIRAWAEKTGRLSR
jgi:hypothetical protein